LSCIFLNPYQVKKYRQALGSKIKTDSINATFIAELIRGRKYNSLYISNDTVLELRELVRVKFSFDRRIKDLKKSTLALLYVVFRQYTKVASHPFSKVSIEILSKYPTSFPGVFPSFFFKSSYLTYLVFKEQNIFKNFYLLVL